MTERKGELRGGQRIEDGEVYERTPDPHTWTISKGVTKSVVEIEGPDTGPRVVIDLEEAVEEVAKSYSAVRWEMLTRQTQDAYRARARAVLLNPEQSVQRKEGDADEFRSSVSGQDATPDPSLEQGGSDDWRNDDEAQALIDAIDDPEQSVHQEGALKAEVASGRSRVRTLTEFKYEEGGRLTFFEGVVRIEHGDQFIEGPLSKDNARRLADALYEYAGAESVHQEGREAS